MTYELYFNILLIVIGIFALIKSGAYVVKSLINIAHFLNVSEFTLSFILMAFATTLPEFSIGISASLNKQPLISLGNIFGSNILNLTLILGLITLIAGKITIDEKDKIHKSWLNFFLAISPIIVLCPFPIYSSACHHLQSYPSPYPSPWFSCLLSLSSHSPRCIPPTHLVSLSQQQTSTHTHTLSSIGRHLSAVFLFFILIAHIPSLAENPCTLSAVQHYIYPFPVALSASVASPASPASRNDPSRFSVLHLFQ